MKKLRVLLADDHPALREGTRFFIDREADSEVCAEASNGREAVEQTALHHPDVVVLDLHMPETDALEVVREIRKASPQAEVVIYSSARADDIVDKLFDYGVKSFIHKSDPTELLLQAIKAAGQHERFLTPAIGEIILRRVMGEPAPVDLTPREREVVRLVAEGRSNKEIATQLKISTRTAEAHRAKLMRKLGFSSSADVIRYAVRVGIIEP